MIIPTAINQSESFIWDFWYYFDTQSYIFHVFFLNANRNLVAHDEHHFSSKVGYATTEDFISFNWISSNVLETDENEWYNTSIWTGDIIKIKSGFLMYFTSRNKNEDDALTQNIGAAFSKNIEGPWHPIKDFRIRPPEVYYMTKTNQNDVSIHAWRDPYLFMHDGNAYMLVTAKVKDKEPRKNGCVALLRSVKNNLMKWQILPPLYAPGFYSEMEVAQIYKTSSGLFRLVYSSPPKWDSTPTTNQSGGLHSVICNQPNEGFHHVNPKVLLPYSSNLYACRIIPELEGEIVGFDHFVGGLKRSGVKVDAIHFGRDFSETTIII